MILSIFLQEITDREIRESLILMNEPFMNIRGEILEKWLNVLNMLANHHEIAILLETHYTMSSFYANCQKINLIY